MARFILEGEWTGYTSAQRRIVHREIISSKVASGLKVNCITYSDGTCLLLSVREAKPREKVEERRSYTALIREAEAIGRARVHVHELKDDDEDAA